MNELAVSGLDVFLLIDEFQWLSFDDYCSMSLVNQSLREFITKSPLWKDGERFMKYCSPIMTRYHIPPRPRGVLRDFNSSLPVANDIRSRRPYIIPMDREGELYHFPRSLPRERNNLRLGRLEDLVHYADEPVGKCFKVPFPEALGGTFRLCSHRESFYLPRPFPVTCTACRVVLKDSTELKNHLELFNHKRSMVQEEIMNRRLYQGFENKDTFFQIIGIRHFGQYCHKKENAWDVSRHVISMIVAICLSIIVLALDSSIFPFIVWFHLFIVPYQFIHAYSKYHSHLWSSPSNS